MHLYFPFTTRTLNDLLNFSINLADDNNKLITFEDNEKKKKKMSTLNFKIDVFLK